MAETCKYIREKSINIFSILFLLTLLSVMGSYAYENSALRILSYLFECALIAYIFIASSRSHSNHINYIAVSIVSIIIVLNYMFSPNEPEYSDLLKFLGYYGCFKYGDYLASRYDNLKVNKICLLLIVFLPALLVAFLDHTVYKNFFFRSPNGFVYLGVAIAAFYLLVAGHDKKHFLIAVLVAAFYILICTSLGVVVAALLAIMVLNLKSTHIIYIILGVFLLYNIILFVDIPIFVRIRDVFNVWDYIFDYNIRDISNVDLHELNNLDKEGERTDSSSSVWRIVHWINLLQMYLSNAWAIPFGLGAGFSVKATDFAPHNCYLQILIEYGLVVFIFFIKFVFKVYRSLKTEGMLIYFILTMLLYYLTENLLYNFPPGALMYFIIGWTLCKYGKNNTHSRKKYLSVVRNAKNGE